MVEERVQRRLAAIMAADVVGYSRLIEADEAGTLSALKARRKGILQPLVAKHQGRIVKLMGDGVLIDFGSAVNAVACAVELQGAMEAANKDLPDDRRIVLRVGVNLGDVVVEGSDFYGEGVNIAARLEALAEPGGVLVSQTVFSHVRGKVQVGFEDLGEQNLRNMVEPVRIYKVSGAIAPNALVSPTRAVSQSKPSIAVLPFTNMSADPEQEYFSDGVTEDIITELTRFRQLFVIARNSSFAFRGKAVSIAEVGRKLGVQYVVEGSVRRTGNRIRITAQLIDSATNNHIWAERYDRDAEDIFAVQDDVAQSIAAALFGQVEDAGAIQAKRKHPENLAAYDYLLRGIDHHQRQTLGNLGPARHLLNKAIEIDPDLAIAYAWLALVDQGDCDFTGSRDYLDSALKNAERAVELDEDDARCHVILGYCLLHAKQLDKAEFHHKRALTLNPNDAHVTAHMGLMSAYLGNTKDAIRWVNKALHLNPYPPDWYRGFLGMAHYVARAYTDAVTNLNPFHGSYPWDRMYSAASYAQLNRIEEARAQVQEWRTLQPNRSLLDYAATEPFKNRDDLEHLVDGLRKAGLPE